MSASTTGQQKNKRREREFAIPERKTRRKARRFSWDLLEIFLMQLYLGSRSLSSSPRGLKHLQPLSLVWNKGKADTYSFIYSCASWDGIHLEMPYSIDHPLLPKTTTSHFTLFLCVRGFLIPPTPPYLPPPFGYWSACECKCFLLEICFKMRKRFLEITWKKKMRGKPHSMYYWCSNKPFDIHDPPWLVTGTLFKQVSRLSEEGQSLSFFIRGHGLSPPQNS